MPKKVRNIESLYVSIDKDIKLAEAYTGWRGLSFVIKMCRLKPQSILSGAHDLKLHLHDWWIDEYGNSLRIKPNKRLSLLLNDPEIKEKVINTDLYSCLPLDKIAKMSKLLYLLVGQDRDRQDHAIIAFLGIDNFLRAFTLINSQWQPIAPLQLGLRILKMLSLQHETTRNYTVLHQKKTVIWPCITQDSGLYSWMPRGKTMSILKKYPYIVDILKIGE